MNNLVIGIFKDESHAEEARHRLLTRGGERTMDVEDSVVMKKTREGKVKFRHLTRETATGATVGAFWGAVLGLLLLNPVFLLAGLLTGFIIGAVYGALTHVGVDADFVRTEADSMAPGDSAVCVLTRDDATKVLEEIERDGHVLQTRLCTQTPDVKECSVRP